MAVKGAQAQDALPCVLLRALGERDDHATLRWEVEHPLRARAKEWGGWPRRITERRDEKLVLQPATALDTR